MGIDAQVSKFLALKLKTKIKGLGAVNSKYKMRTQRRTCLVATLESDEDLPRAAPKVEQFPGNSSKLLDFLMQEAEIKRKKRP